MSTVFSNKIQRNWQISVADLENSWKTLTNSNTDIRDIVHILKRFDIATEYPLTGSLLIVPSLLTLEKPPHLKKKLDEATESRFSRSYVVQYLPPGSFSRIFVTLVKELGNK